MFIIISATFFTVAIYTVIAVVFKVPTFKISNEINRHNKSSETKKPIGALVMLLADKLAAYIPVSTIKTIKLERMLKALNINITAKQYTAKLIVIFTLILFFAIPLYFIWSWLALVPLPAAIITIVVIRSEDVDKASKCVQEIEDELPRFINTFTSSIKSNRNVLNIIETYKLNFSDTPLSKELSITIADMRTGQPEIALQRLELRVNSSLMSELVRGIIATIRGEDMRIYFDVLSNKASTIWQQRLTESALKTVPKVSILSNIRAMWSILTMIIVVIAIVVNQI